MSPPGHVISRSCSPELSPLGEWLGDNAFRGRSSRACGASWPAAARTSARCAELPDRSAVRAVTTRRCLRCAGACCARCWMPLALTWLAGSGVAVTLAYRFTRDAFDRSLLDDACRLAANVSADEGGMALTLSPRGGGGDVRPERAPVLRRRAARRHARRRQSQDLYARRRQTRRQRLRRFAASAAWSCAWRCWRAAAANDPSSPSSARPSATRREHLGFAWCWRRWCRSSPLLALLSAYGCASASTASWRRWRMGANWTHRRRLANYTCWRRTSHARPGAAGRGLQRSAFARGHRRARAARKFAGNVAHGCATRSPASAR